ncbi:cysteine desulfurase IscS [Chlorobiota bacterium]|nr:cysteine desulfurase IscS [Chlorobiota bacterium]
MIYLDNSATTQIDKEVVESMLPWLYEEYGNPSSIYSLGRKARVSIENARTEIAHALHAHPAEIIFTSGGTESNNTVLKSCIHESQLVKALAISSIEHHAIIHPAESLSKQGIPVQYIHVNQDGLIPTDELKNYQLDNTLISIMHANNETGCIQPIKAIKDLLPSSALLHSDAVQSLGKIPVFVDELGIDFLTISAHKIHGPKGIGALFIKKGIDFKAHQQGGGQERNRRAGTESPALIVGFQTAVRIAINQLEKNAEHMYSLKQFLINNIISLIPDIHINGPMDSKTSLPSIVNISFPNRPNIDGESLLQMMDIQDIAVSNGSACVSGSQQPSHVLSAMGRSQKEAKAAIRFSFSKYTTETEILKAIHTLKDILDSFES